MAEPLPPPSLARAREQKISELSEHFANDDLSLEDLERRIERVYKATSVADLELITSDLRGVPVVVDQPQGRTARGSDAAPVVATTFETARARLLAIMSTTRRTGRWAVPRDLRIVALMSDTKLDMTNAAMPVGGVVNIELTAVMASFKVVVPPGVRVVNEMHSVMADVRSSADELLPDSPMRPTTPLIRLVGTALMADVKVKVRRREEPYVDDDED